MADVKTFIWHDEHGAIIAVGHVTADYRQNIEPKAQTGQGVLEVRMDEADLATLHVTHRVDLTKGTLCMAPTAS